MSTFTRFFPFLRPYLPRMAVAGLLIMGVAAINLALLRLAGKLWDVITVQHDHVRMTELISVFLGLVILQGFCSMGHSYLTTWVSQRIVADFRTHLFAHLQTLAVSFFARRRTGELLSRLMNDVTVIQSVVTETPIDTAKQLVTFVGGIGFLLAMNWRLCLLILVLLPLLVLVARFFGRKLKALSTSIQDQTASLSTLIEEVISGIRVVKSFVQTKREEARFSAQLEHTLSLTLHRAKIMAVFIPVISLLTFSAAAAVLWYGGSQVIVAIVGPTGAGKTTVINLLHRFYDPTDGRITVDGKNLRHITMESWYRHVALVPQETILFGGTILDNIRYGNARANEDAILDASRAAHAHEFIMSLPDQYKTILGEKGINLSGGQRQRVAIARAILKNPRILLLDEATSALDSESERLVQEALEQLMKGRTTFVVAHRLTTVQRADRIIVLNKGRVAEAGTHQQLMDQRGLYHYLYTLRLTELSS